MTRPILKVRLPFRNRQQPLDWAVEHKDLILSNSPFRYCGSDAFSMETASPGSLSNGVDRPSPTSFLISINCSMICIRGISVSSGMDRSGLGTAGSSCLYSRNSRQLSFEEHFLQTSICFFCRLLFLVHVR